MPDRSLSVVVHSDGGARGNPGEAACAAVAYDTDGVELLTRSKRLGVATNNAAEYEGVVMALELCRELGAADVVVRTDSELIARQIQGKYRVKHRNLKPYHARVMALAGAFRAFSIEHVPRDENQRADAIVNACLDGRDEPLE